jgi:hypothetical protein
MAHNPRELEENLRLDRERREKERLLGQHEHVHQQKRLRKADRRDRNETNAQESFEKLRKIVEENEHRGIQGYDTLVSAALQVSQMCFLIAKGLSSYDVWDDHPLAKMIKALIPKDKREAFAARSYLKEKERIENSTPAITLPDIKYSLAMSDDGELQMDSVIDRVVLSDGSVLTDNQKDIYSRAMKQITTGWLATQGYVPEAATGRANHFVLPVGHANNTTAAEIPLTPAEFQRLRDDPNHGLDQFLTAQMGLNLEHAGPRP